MFGVTVKVALEYLRDAIAEDAALRAWAEAIYGAGKDPVVQIGFNAANPPDADSGPVVFLVPSPYQTGKTEILPDTAIVVAMGWILNDSRKVETTATAGKSATLTYSGVTACIDFGDLLLAAIYARYTDVFELADVQIAVEDMPSWPLIQGAARLELRLKGAAPTP